MSADPRSRAQRRRAPYLPLSLDWEGEALLVTTPTNSPTGRNLAATRTGRLGLGHTPEASIMEGEVEVLEVDALPRQRVTASPPARTGPGPRGSTGRGEGESDVLLVAGQTSQARPTETDEGGPASQMETR